jgi:hypothetical protein
VGLGYEPVLDWSCMVVKWEWCGSGLLLVTSSPPTLLSTLPTPLAYWDMDAPHWDMNVPTPYEYAYGPCTSYTVNLPIM